MPIKHALWKVSSTPSQLPLARLTSEEELEEMIAQDIRILSGDWMLIGRQVQTGYNGRIDLLAITPEAALVLIELKRERTPRDVVAQALDYASWVGHLNAEQVKEIYREFKKGGDLGKDFKARFKGELDDEVLSEGSHQIILVASELDASTERIVTYLSEQDVPINVLFFQVFSMGDERLLSRAWMMDPQVTEWQAPTPREEKKPWNNEYYVVFGGSEVRVWEDARKYGYISAGGGARYIQALSNLNPGDRIWVKLSEVGYVGVARVLAKSVSVNEFMVNSAGVEKPCLEVLSTAAELRKTADDPENAEHFVKVEWLDQVPESQACAENGLFGIPSVVCRPRVSKWLHTIERLKTKFPKWNRDAGKVAGETR